MVTRQRRNSAQGGAGDLTGGYPMTSSNRVNDIPIKQGVLSADAIRGFAEIVSDWKVSDEDAALLLGIPVGDYLTFRDNADHAQIEPEQIERILHLVGIVIAARTAYGQDLGDKWAQLANTNRLFQGSTPLAYMQKQGIDGIVEVRRYLQARTQGQ